MTRKKPSGTDDGPADLQNLWHAYNLRRSPFFQETLGQENEPDHSLDLFVARRQEAKQMLATIAGGSSSREVVTGVAGIGKTTLVQYVKSQAAAYGYLSVSTPISLAHADNADRLLEKLLSYVYEALITHKRAKAILKHEAIDVARQIVRVFKFREISPQLSVLGSGGGWNAQTQFVSPQTFSASLAIPSLLRDLMQLARTGLQAKGIIVHMNNVENMTAAEQAHAGLVLRDIRDLTLLPGFHYILAGTTDAIREIIQPHAQLRSVFGIARHLDPLTATEFRDLLHRRYERLRLDARQPIRHPIEWPAVDEVYREFRGDLRGALRALDQGTAVLLGYGSRAGGPMALNELRVVLRAVYLRETEAMLPAALFRDFQTLRKVKDKHFTQRALTRHWKVTQGSVSIKLTQLAQMGFVAIAARQPGHETSYRLTGAAHLALA